MSLYKTFQTNEKAEREGVILDYGPNSKGEPTEIRVARAGGGNVKYAKALELRLKPYRRQVMNEVIEPKVLENIFMEVYADTVVLGWSGVELRDGTPLPYSRENVIRLFKDLPALFEDIKEQSQKIALFREEIREAEQGN